MSEGRSFVDFVHEEDHEPLKSFLASSEGNREGKDEMTPTHVRVCLRGATRARFKVDVTAISFQDVEGHTFCSGCGPG